MTVLYNKIALIGLGLIASSVALAARQAGIVNTITGTARSKETREIARDVGFCDEITETTEDAVKDADLVILAVPVGAMSKIAAEIAPALKKGAIVTDVGSVKKTVIADVMPHLPDDVIFIPGHPLAGTEHSGPRAGFPELFKNRWWLFTPLSGTPPSELARLETFIQAFGAKTDRMDADHHDLVLAVTSHVPHLIAYTMVGIADDLKRVTENEVINYSATGFRDFTRIAASDPTMWRDVFLNNKDATLEILGRFTEELFALQRAIRTGDGDTLFDYFTHTRAIRRGILDAGQDVNIPDFGRVGAKPNDTQS